MFAIVPKPTGVVARKARGATSTPDSRMRILVGHKGYKQGWNCWNDLNHVWAAKTQNRAHQVEIMGLPPANAYQSSKARIARRMYKTIFLALSSAAPLVEVTANAGPHFRQNREPSGNSVPQFEQNTPDLHQQMSCTTQHTAVLRAGRFMSRGRGYCRHWKSQPHLH